MRDITDYLEKEQVDQLLDATKACNVRDYLMMRVLWRTGTRVSELLNIKPSDIEFQNQVVNITKAKGGIQRRVLLDEETLKLLSDYISTQNIPLRISRFLASNVVKFTPLSRNMVR